MTIRIAATSAVLLALPLSVAAMSHGGPMTASATMQTADGGAAGSVSFEQNGGGVLIRAELTGLPPGEHAIHLHATGSCEDGFAAAGDHFNPAGTEHGVLNPNGAHAGDLPNIVVGEDGAATVHFITADVTLDDAEASLADQDGAAVIVHENPDSYMKDAGAGGRIACGVIEVQ